MPHGVSFRDLQDYRELTDVFSGLLGLQPQGAWLNTGSRIDRVVLEAVTENAFSLLGVRPAVGRVLVPSDEHSSVLVLAHDYWRVQFNADPSVVGQSVRLNAQAVHDCRRRRRVLHRPRVAAQGVGLRADVGPEPHLGRHPRGRGVARRSGSPCAHRDRSPRGRRQHRAGTRGAGRQGRRARRAVPGDERGRPAARGARNAGATRAAERPDVPRRRGGALGCWPDCCCSSRAPTWPTCCWHAPRRGAGRWPCARRSAPAADESSVSCSPRASCSRCSAAQERCCSRLRRPRRWSTGSRASRSGCRSGSTSASTGECSARRSAWPSWPA